MSAYDRWLTTPPEDALACAHCGEQVVDDPRDPEDEPHARAANGEGWVCSARCQTFDALALWAGPKYAEKRLQLVQEALGEEVELDLLRVELKARASDGRSIEVVGTPIEWDVNRLVLENADSDEVTLHWTDLADVEVVDA